MAIIVNTEGLREIEEFLWNNHKKIECFAASQISALAGEAEDHFEETGVAFIEIKAWETLSGKVEILYLRPNHYVAI